MSATLLLARQSFDPRSIGNLLWWFDASDASTVTTVDGNVSSWSSKGSGSHSVIQTTALNRPTYTTSGRNGLNTINFDGTNDLLSISLPPRINQPFTVIWVGNSTGPARGVAPMKAPQIFDNGGNVFLQWNISEAQSTNGQLGFSSNGAANTVEKTGSSTAYNAWSVVTAIFNTTSSKLRANGTQVASGNCGSGYIIGTLSMGSVFGGASYYFFNGPWGGFLLYNTALTDAQCLAVETYLANRFAVVLS